ncbi:MAG: hypothetical protein Q4A32_07895 [Lachnospiraceae bacterium]|nr:hypothetical protein [Lachnospiraceae bacterium]
MSDSMNGFDESNRAIEEKKLDVVNGGTFTGNDFPREIYEMAGFKCEYNFFAKDVFIKDGVRYDHGQANEIMKAMGYARVYEYRSINVAPYEEEIVRYTYKGKYIK